MISLIFAFSVFLTITFLTIKILPIFLLRRMRRKICKFNNLQDLNIEINGLKWQYLRGGKGRKLLLIPGFGSHRYQWGDGLYHLSNQFELIIPDMPGLGETVIEDSYSLDLEAQTKRLIDFLDKIRVENTIVIGVSIGGYIGTLLTINCPHLVDQLILIDPAGISPDKMTPALTSFVETGAHPFGYRNIDELDLLYKFLFSEPPKIPRIVKRHLASRNRKYIPSRKRALSDIRPFIQSGLDAYLPNLPGRTMVIWGQKDQLFDCSSLNTVLSLAPHVKTQLLDCGHLPHLERPNQTVKTIINFLNQ